MSTNKTSTSPAASLARRIIGIVTAFHVIAVILLGSTIINAIQALIWCLVFIPLTTRIAWTQWLANTWWELLCFTTEVWAHIEYTFTGAQIKANENSILIGNHAGGMDFTTGICVASRAPGIGTGRCMTMMKDSLKYVPTIGFMHYFQGSLFLKRNWEKDHKMIDAKLQSMENGTFPRPFWLALYPEGTRITPSKKAASLAFAKERGLPQLQNVLLPRTKGFTFILQSLPTCVDSIYDVTSGYTTAPLYPHHPFIYGRFQTTCVHIHIERIPISDVPKDETQQAEWLMQRFVKKDELLAYFEQHGHFPGTQNAAFSTRFQYLRALFGAWAFLFAVVTGVMSGSWNVFVLGLLFDALTIASTYIPWSAPVTKSSASRSTSAAPVASNEAVSTSKPASQKKKSRKDE